MPTRISVHAQEPRHEQHESDTKVGRVTAVVQAVAQRVLAFR
jgi:hypothetical protein